MALVGNSNLWSWSVLIAALIILVTFFKKSVIYEEFVGLNGHGWSVGLSLGIDSWWYLLGFLCCTFIYFKLHQIRK